MKTLTLNYKLRPEKLTNVVRYDFVLKKIPISRLVEFQNIEKLIIEIFRKISNRAVR